MADVTGASGSGPSGPAERPAKEQANAVREGAELFEFPPEHIMRPQPGHRGDQVALTHRGETKIFPTEAAFYADIRAVDPERRALAANIARDQELARTQLALAKLDRAAAGHARRQADRMLRLIATGAFISAGLALLLVVAR